MLILELSTFNKYLIIHNAKKFKEYWGDIFYFFLHVVNVPRRVKLSAVSCPKLTNPLDIFLNISFGAFLTLILG